MKCFYHDDRDAIGICKSCGRGLCRECCFEFRKGLACRGRCEDDAAAVASLIEQSVEWQPWNVAVLRSQRRVSKRYGPIAIILGIIMGLVALLGDTDAGTRTVSAVMAFLFVTLGGILLRRGRFMPTISKHALGHCAHCDYDLKGNTSGVCPECGERL